MPVSASPAPPCRRSAGRVSASLGVLAVLAAFAPAGATMDLADGETLFERHCVLCHGEEGRGDGPVADLLSPAPRDFGGGLFQVVSTWNGVPTDQDLVRSIARGVPGSGMPPYSFLADDELASLARYVRALAVAGIAEDIGAALARRGRTIDAEQVQQEAERRMVPGEPIDVAPPPDATDARLAQGRRGFQSHCAACHGDRGQGRQLVDPWSDTRFPWSRDFTRGLLVGGASHEELVKRIVAGMPGAGMPPSRFEEPDMAASIALYVRSLIPQGAEDRLVRRRLTIPAPRVESLPQDGDDEGWEAIDATRVVLAPLAWHGDAPDELAVRFAHDGSDLAVRLEWADASRDDRALGTSRFPDGVALQLSLEDSPPLFGMGSEAFPVDIWHWKAFRMEQVAGVFDLTGPPSPGEPSTDVPRFRVCEGLLEPSTRAGSRQVDGLESAARIGSQGEIPAAPRWRDGRWTVVLHRSLAARGAGEVGLAPDTEAEVSFAVWNGSAGDRGGRKSISIWQRLAIAR